MTTAEVLLQAAHMGLTLSREGDHLRVIPASACPPEFATMLRSHKPVLMKLLITRFWIVKSAALTETVFFASDDCTRDALIKSGAKPASIYTRDELRTLVDRHARNPITQQELRLLHTAKRTFNGRVVENDR